MTSPLLELHDFKTYLHTEDGDVKAVDGIHLAVEEGKTLGIVGESGSGKSVTAYSILRLVPESIVALREGSITYRCAKGAVDLAELPIEEMPFYRGGEIAMVFQEPMTSLNPVLCCGYQLAEAWERHHKSGWEQAWRESTHLLEEVGIAWPSSRMRQYPHELSGGMKQRVMIAMALACGPRLLICDEPTTALDVTIQKQILDLIRAIQRDRNMAVLYITHDLGVVAAVTDQVAVMCPGDTLRRLYERSAGDAAATASETFQRGGQIVEFGSVSDIFSRPQHPYTKGLIACRPSLSTRSSRLPTIDDFIRAEVNGIKLDATDPDLDLEYPGRARARREDKPGHGEPLLEVSGLRTWFPITAGLLGRTVGWVKAVDDVDLAVRRGQTLGLVGESGCGKTTLGRTICQLIRPMEGTIRYAGVDVTGLRGHEMRALRRKMQIIFQDPYSSLNPRMSVEDIVTEPMAIFAKSLSEGARRDRAVQLLERVGLRATHLHRYPHEFSGGQRQRIGIARVLAVEPEFIVCDEAVSSLDVSIQAGIINLLLDLQDELGLTYIFISHDLSVVKYVSDVVAVMANDAITAELFEGEEHERLMARDRGGHVVELNDPDILYRDPKHPYTKRLLAAIP